MLSASERCLVGASREIINPRFDEMQNILIAWIVGEAHR